jgi:ferredoxin
LTTPKACPPVVGVQPPITMKKVTIGKDKCIGCFACEDITGGLFKVVNGIAQFDSKADLKDPKVQKKIKLAMDACPMQAIKIEK